MASTLTTARRYNLFLGTCALLLLCSGFAFGESPNDSTIIRHRRLTMDCFHKSLLSFVSGLEHMLFSQRNPDTLSFAIPEESLANRMLETDVCAYFKDVSVADATSYVLAKHGLKLDVVDETFTVTKGKESFFTNDVTLAKYTADTERFLSQRLDILPLDIDGILNMATNDIPVIIEKTASVDVSIPSIKGAEVQDGVTIGELLSKWLEDAGLRYSIQGRIIRIQEGTAVQDGSGGGVIH